MSEDRSDIDARMADIEAFLDGLDEIDEKVAKVTESVKKVNFDKVTKGLDKVKKFASGNFGKVAEKIANSKFVKGAKELGKTAKNIAASSIQSQILGKLVDTIGPLLNILNFLDPPLKALSALFAMLSGQVLSEIMPYMGDLAKIMMELSPLFLQLGMILGQLMAAGLEPSVEFWTRLGPPLIEVSLIIMDKLMPAINAIIGVISWWEQTIMKIWTTIGEGLIGALTQADGKLTEFWSKIQAIGAWISDVFSHIWGKMKADLEIIGNWLSTTFGPAWNKIKDVLIIVGKFLKEELTEGWNNFTSQMRTVADFLKKVFIPVWDGIKTVFTAVGNYIAHVFTPLWTAIKENFKAVKDSWNSSGGLLFGSNGLIATGFRNVVNLVKGIINSIITPINDVIDVINDVPGIDLGTIPLLAKGGMVSAPTLAMIGEGREKEVVSPMSEAKSMVLEGIERARDPEVPELLRELISLQRDYIQLLKNPNGRAITRRY